MIRLFLLMLVVVAAAVAPTVDRRAPELDAVIDSTVRAEVVARQSQEVVRP